MPFIIDKNWESFNSQTKKKKKERKKDMKKKNENDRRKEHRLSLTEKKYRIIYIITWFTICKKLPKLIKEQNIFLLSARKRNQILTWINCPFSS